MGIDVLCVLREGGGCMQLDMFVCLERVVHMQVHTHGYMHIHVHMFWMFCICAMHFHIYAHAYLVCAPALVQHSINLRNLFLHLCDSSENFYLHGERNPRVVIAFSASTAVGLVPAPGH